MSPGPGLGRQSSPIRNPAIGPDEEIQPDFLRIAHVQGDITTVYSVYSDNTYYDFGRNGQSRRPSAGFAQPAQSGHGCHDQQSFAPDETTSCMCNSLGRRATSGYLNDMQIETMHAGVSWRLQQQRWWTPPTTVWRNNVGTTNTLPNDPIGGTIGQTQYNTWRSNFGMMAGAAADWERKAPSPSRGRSCCACWRVLGPRA